MIHLKQERLRQQAIQRERAVVGNAAEHAMNGFFRLMRGAMLAAAMLCAATTAFCADCELSLGWEPWEPYQYKDGETLTGLDVELVSAIFERANCKITYVEAP